MSAAYDHYIIIEYHSFQYFIFPLQNYKKFCKKTHTFRKIH